MTAGTTASAASHPDERIPFRRILLRVMTVQAVTLLLLWLLQVRYTP